MTTDSQTDMASKKLSAIDLIKSNFNFIQNQYKDDYEKQDLIGYDEALVQIDDFVMNNSQKSSEFMVKKNGINDNATVDPREAALIIDPNGDMQKKQVIDYRNMQNDENCPLVITGDEGCGKTQLIIKWLTEFNRKDKISNKNDDNSNTQLVNLNNTQSMNTAQMLENGELTASQYDQRKKAHIVPENPNINKNGNVVFTFFAGIESINSMIQLDSLLPIKKNMKDVLKERGSPRKSKTSVKQEPTNPSDSKKTHTESDKYQTFIYNIMTKIRQVYKVDKRVEILDDQLRTNFRKWLEIANKMHKDNMDKNTQIILILDGPENFLDENGNQQSVDWIPTTFPAKFKVIILSKLKSKAMKMFIQRKYPMILLKGLHLEQNFKDICAANDFDYKREQAFYEKMKQFIQFQIRPNTQIITRESWEGHEEDNIQLLSRKSDLRKNPTFLTCLVLFRHIFDHIKQATNICDLFQRIMHNYYEKKSPLERQLFLQILIYLSNTRKGLILAELEDLLVTQDQFDAQMAKDAVGEFVEIFDFAYTYSPTTDQLMSQNFQFVQTVAQLITSINEKRMKGTEQAELAAMGDEGWPTINEHVVYGQKNVCKKITELIEKQSFSLRQIDELAFQYQKSRNWQRLNDLISSIEVFSILYNPETKHQLAQYWQMLEQYKYDPVAEYNRTLEGFVQRYNPNNDELFVILIQLSRFLRELADFETRSTPQFKHPSLRGNQELAKITLLNELNRLGQDIYTNSDDKLGVKDAAKVVKCNMENPISRQNFKQELIKQIEEEQGYAILNALKKKVGEPPEPKQDHLMLNYYYKRWLWVQFPWWCINIYQDFSEIMELSVSLSNLRPELIKSMTADDREKFEMYFSIAQENELVLKTLNILKDAKLRKGDRFQGQFNRKRELMTIMHPNTNDHNNSITSSMMSQAVKEGPLRVGLTIQHKQKKKPIQIHENLFMQNQLNVMKRQILKDSQESEADLQLKLSKNMTSIMDQVKGKNMGRSLPNLHMNKRGSNENLGLSRGKTSSAAGLPPLPRTQTQAKFGGTMPAHKLNLYGTHQTNLSPIKERGSPDNQRLVRPTYSSSLKQEFQSRKAQHLKKAFSGKKVGIDPAEKGKKLEADNTYNNKLFLDVRHQIFYRHKSIDVARIDKEKIMGTSSMNMKRSPSKIQSGSSQQWNQDGQKIEYGETGALQSNLNKMIRPKNVIEMLKEKQDVNIKNRVIQLQENNIKLSQHLNQRLYEIKNLEIQIKESRQEHQILGLETKEKNKTVKLTQIENLEARLMITHENLNLAQVEKDRMEQILMVLSKNPADSPEFTIQLTNTTLQIRKLINFEESTTKVYKVQTKKFTKEINFMIQQIQKRMLQKDMIFDEIEKYILQACKQNQQEKMDNEEVKKNIKMIIDNKQREIKDILAMKLRKMMQQKKNMKQAPNLNEILAQDIEAKNQQTSGIISARVTKENKQKALGDLQKRLQHLSQWKTRLQITVAFVNEKKEFLMNNFQKVSEITSIHNPMDFEGLSGIIEKSDQLQKQNQKKLQYIELLKQQKEHYQNKMQKLQEKTNQQVQRMPNNLNFFDQQDNYQNQLQDKQQQLKLVKDTYQLQVQQIAQIKSGLYNLQKKLQKAFPNMEMPSIQYVSSPAEMMKHLNTMLKQYKYLEQVYMQKKFAQRKNTFKDLEEVDQNKSLKYLKLQHKDDTKRALGKDNLKQLIQDISLETSKRDVKSLEGDTNTNKDDDFYKNILKNRAQNDNVFMKKKTPKQSKINKSPKGGLNKSDLGDSSKDNSSSKVNHESGQIKILPKFKAGDDIMPILTVMRQKIKTQQKQTQKPRFFLQLLDDKLVEHQHSKGEKDKSQSPINVMPAHSQHSQMAVPGVNSEYGQVPQYYVTNPKTTLPANIFQESNDVKKIKIMKIKKMKNNQSQQAEEQVQEATGATKIDIDLEGLSDNNSKDSEEDEKRQIHLNRLKIKQDYNKRQHDLMHQQKLKQNKKY